VPHFVDTNVLVYAEDLDAGAKHDVARDLVLELWAERTGVVSIQVLAEFYVIVTRKLRRPLAPGQAREIVEQYLAWQVVHGSPALLRAGMRRATAARLSLWDALIVEAAASRGCERLYTEDLHDGQVFGRVRVVNPFAGI
jgi:predicted nucleic acid-binding protein